MPFAAAISEHPVPSIAVGEVVGTVLDALGEGPDLAVLFVGASHTGTVEDVAGAVRMLLRPRVLVGCTTSTVVGMGREVEDAPALSLWAGRLPVATPVRLATERRAEGGVVTGFPPAPAVDEQAGALLLLADPYSFPVESFLGGLREQVGTDLAVVGGLASAARGPGGNRLLLDGKVFTDGAVGVLVGGLPVSTVVSQGCRPVGDPMVVTSCEGQLIAELAGRPALDRVEQVLAGLGPDDLDLARRGLHLGRVIDEHKVDYGRGDFLIRNLLGADRQAGAIVVGDDVALGATVQLQVRDGASADEDLRHLLAPCRPEGALLFTCTGRGTHLFGVPDHDAGALADVLGQRLPVAGMSCAGELGPVGRTNFLHGFTASVVLFGEPQGRIPGAG